MTKLGFDIDGVLYPWHEIVHEYYGDILAPGVNFFDFWKVPDGWMTQHEGTVGVKNMVHDPLMYTKRSIRPDFLKAVNEVAEMVDELWYITMRPPDCKTDTSMWLKRNRLPSFKNLIFEPGTEKSEHVAKLGVSIYVEDRPVHINDLIPVECLTTLVVVNTPYNMTMDLPEKCVRINSVLELPDIVRRLTSGKSVV